MITLACWLGRIRRCRSRGPWSQLQCTYGRRHAGRHRNIRGYCWH